MQSNDTQTGSILQPGTPAPDFELGSTPGKTIKLSDLRGKPVIIAFYPADWSPVCGDQIALYNEILPEFQEYGAQIVGISVDSVWCHAAYSKAKNIRFPLLSDFEPKGDVAKAFGAYCSDDGTAERALFVIDGNGMIRWSFLSDIDVNPGADGILNALESIRAGSSDAMAERSAGTMDARP